MPLIILTTIGRLNLQSVEWIHELTCPADVLESEMRQARQLQISLIRDDRGAILPRRRQSFWWGPMDKVIISPSDE